MHIRIFDSPIGRLLLSATEDAITAIDFMTAGGSESISSEGHSPILGELERQLTEYFGGQRKSFDIPVQFSDGTAGVLWTFLRDIPYGNTVSYKQFAAQVGRPRAVRAVASIIGRNPLPILFPCHRVVGSDGRLRGFRGGLEAKRWLLKAEGVPLAR
jgi:methylated-DNA-[protein]-cysteine S-methyltransferase